MICVLILLFCKEGCSGFQLHAPSWTKPDKFYSHLFTNHGLNASREIIKSDLFIWIKLCRVLEKFCNHVEFFWKEEYRLNGLICEDTFFFQSIQMYDRKWLFFLATEKKEMTGLAIGVSNMKAGERALMHVGWELGYGEEGSFSFPNVPPKADIIYEVELIGFDETKEGKARGDMTAEERIGAADRRKMDGNALFNDEKLEEAMQQYEMAIAYLGDDFMFQLFGKYRDMALAVKNPCHLNMAACLIKLKHYEEAIAQCGIVLVEDENNVKALFRRGKARAELGQTDAAREDFLKARKYAPENKAIARELRLLAEHDKAVYRKQKEIYKGIFGPPPEPKPEQTNLLIRFWEWLIILWQWLLALIYRLFRRETRKAD